MSKKTLEELVFHDDFMFAAVMMDAENCRCFLERVLEIQIERVEISTEHGFFFNPECKSIRMDVFAKDENRTHYDIEMQLVKKDSLEKRSRYYHSQMDVEMLEKGKSYGELADTYVIFILSPAKIKNGIAKNENDCTPSPKRRNTDDTYFGPR